MNDTSNNFLYVPKMVSVTVSVYNAMRKARQGNAQRLRGNAQHSGANNF